MIGPFQAHERQYTYVHIRIFFFLFCKCIFYFRDCIRFDDNGPDLPTPHSVSGLSGL